jgi:hypothetical protein
LNAFVDLPPEFTDKLKNVVYSKREKFLVVQYRANYGGRFESGYVTAACALWNVEINTFSPCRSGNFQN